MSAARVYAGANEKFGRPWWDYGESVRQFFRALRSLIFHYVVKVGRGICVITQLRSYPETSLELCGLGILFRWLDTLAPPSSIYLHLSFPSCTDILVLFFGHSIPRSFYSLIL